MFLCFRVGVENRQRRILINERLQNHVFCFCIVFAQHTNFCVLAVGHAAVPGKETPPSQYLLDGDALF